MESKIEREGLVFCNVLDAPFSVLGLFYEDGKFRRIPRAVAETVNEGVLRLHANTAGGRVRFHTNSPYVAIHAEMDAIGKMPHFRNIQIRIALYTMALLLPKADAHQDPVLLMKTFCPDPLIVTM